MRTGSEKDVRGGLIGDVKARVDSDDDGGDGARRDTADMETRSRRLEPPAYRLILRWWHALPHLVDVIRRGRWLSDDCIAPPGGGRGKHPGYPAQGGECR